MQTTPEPILTAESNPNRPVTTLEPPPNLSSSLALANKAHLPITTQLADPQPATFNAQLTPATIIVARQLPASDSGQHHKARRKGRIASLPKLQRDMVGRMLRNGVPYKNIVAALSDSGFNISERNVSTWATGGYLEWRFEQDLVLQNRLDQDHLIDHLRRDDASELPEAGLQAAATRLSQILIQKTARAEDVEAHLGSFSQMVDILSRLTREISTLQNQRDASRRSLGRAHDPARIKDDEELSAIEAERFYSDPPSDSTLAKPAVPPLLPAEPTSSVLADYDREQAEEQKLQHAERFNATLRSLHGLNPPAAPVPAARSPKPAHVPALPPKSAPQLPAPASAPTGADLLPSTPIANQNPSSR